jgi:hypothetical protein
MPRETRERQRKRSLSTSNFSQALYEFVQAAGCLFFISSEESVRLGNANAYSFHDVLRSARQMRLTHSNRAQRCLKRSLIGRIHLGRNIRMPLTVNDLEEPVVTLKRAPENVDHEVMLADIQCPAQR